MEPDNKDSNQVETKKPKGGFREKLGAPSKITAEDFLKAIQNVSDKGGKAKIGDLVELFGGEKKREYLSRSLIFAEELGFLTRDGTTYVLDQSAKDMLAANEDTKKAMLAAKLATFQPYRDVLLRLKSEKDRQLRKKTLTEAWTNIAGGGGKKIRQLMTMTFASLAEYAGIVDDSGMTLTLSARGLQLLDTGGLNAAPPPGPSPADLGLGLAPQTSPVPAVAFACPRCKGTDIGVMDEEAIQYFHSNGGSVVLIKYKLLCRTCKESFSRHGQQSIPGVRT